MVPDWKTKGKRRTLADSFGDAARGILFAVKTERNMRIHVTAAVYVLFFARFLGVSRGEYAALLLAVALVITAEGFNTAIEMLLPVYHPNTDSLPRLAELFQIPVDRAQTQVGIAGLQLGVHPVRCRMDGSLLQGA